MIIFTYGYSDTSKIVMKVGELMGVEIKEDDLSVSHRLPASRKYRGKKMFFFLRRIMKTR